jgi:CPA1 family monovalent cation:H+ antiporter
MTPCSHLSTSRDVPEADSTQGCADCLREGGWWVHLRQCVECGHVACCDSSPARHATAHFHASTHPVVRSFEPGETWRWCYVDQQVA